MKPELLDESEWSQLGELIAHTMGLHFPPARRLDLERGVTHAAQELGQPEPAGYVRRLLAAPPAQLQLQLLARHLTIGETYFFRDRRLLQALSGQILPALIHSRRGRDQRLRLWSAGCASGEEAYTLAILLHQALPDLAEWEVTITATDLNPAALQEAAAGLYGGWSFRKPPARLQRDYFERRPDGRHALAPHIKRMVKFGYLNLVEDGYPSTETATSAMDIIFCRNVLMYFTPGQARAVAGRLQRALVDGGWLAVSPCETSQALFAPLTHVNFPGAIAYRKGGPAAASVVAAAAPEVSEAPTPRVAEPAALQARAHANRGELAQALAWCDRWIAGDPLDPAAHYVRAVVLIEGGGLEQARSALLRATLLDAGFVLAHFALGTLARRQQRNAEAALHFAATRSLLEGCAPGDLLAEGEGLSAGPLLKVLAGLAEREATA